MSESGVPFVIIDHSEEAVQRAMGEGYLTIAGDAEDESILRQAEIQSARGLILAIANDSVNVFVTLTAREVNPSLFILVRSRSHHNRRKLLRAGADRVVAANEIGASRMTQVILRPHVERFLGEVVRSKGLDFSLREVRIHKHSAIAGKSLKDSKFRQQYRTMVVAIVEGKTQIPWSSTRPLHRCWRKEMC